MKIVIEASLAMLFSISTFAVEHGVESVHTVFVKGNNRVAVSLRKEFIKRFEGSKRKGMESCFKLVSKARAAGAVLEVTQDS
jgi:hypothetical protein